MIAYRHFALPNLFLANGYEEIITEDGVEREYHQEDELEQCVRRLLLRNPAPLRGWDLRFLRHGLGLSQSEFGQMVERDAQTVARWEKSPDPVPKFADVMIRIRFAERFEPSLAIGDVLSFADGTAKALPKRITLTLGDDGWNFDLKPSLKLATRLTHTNTTAELPSGYDRSVRIYVSRWTKGHIYQQEAEEAFWSIDSDPASAREDLPMIEFLSDAISSVFTQENAIDEHANNYVH